MYAIKFKIGMKRGQELHHIHKWTWPLSLSSALFNDLGYDIHYVYI